MKLYLVHCGYYDKNISGGVYESHTNFFVAAESVIDAKLKAKALPEYRSLKMHVDGVQEIEAVDGYEIQLKKSARLSHQTIVHNVKGWSRRVPLPNNS